MLKQMQMLLPHLISELFSYPLSR